MLAKTNNYRPDIDGLRAFAVASVVVFHAFPQALTGGFIGVDVFFVVSGYLITRIIENGLQGQSFGFASFYLSRLRRIFPALLLVLAVTFVLGNILLPIAAIDQLKTEIFAGLGFYANILFWSQVGYFDTAAETKPLLHLWSLGIEEQFYAVWPLCLWMMFRFRLPAFVITCAIVIGSFVVNLVLAGHNSLDAFYLPQARAWQLGAGALLALAPGKGAKTSRTGDWRQSLMALCGAALICLSVFLIAPTQAYPGWRAVFPTLGTVLIISAGGDAWLNRKILSNRVVVGLGLISYPLYLWHWPALSFARMLDANGPPVGMRLSIIAASVVAAALTYLIIEKPIRFGRFTRFAWNMALPALAVALASFVALAPVHWSHKTLSAEQMTLITELRQASHIRERHLTNLYGEKPCFKTQLDQTFDLFIRNGCLDIQNPDAKTVFLIGDSHSASLSLGLRPYLADMKVNLLQVSTGWCEPTSDNLDDKTCQDINQNVAKRIESVKPDLLIIDSSWLAAQNPPYFLGAPNFYQHFLTFISRMASLGPKKIVVVGQIPAWYTGLPELLTQNFVNKNRPIPARTSEGLLTISLMTDDIMRSLNYPPNVSYISLRDVLCDSSGCLTSLGPDFAQDIIVWDESHMTPNAAKYVMQKAFGPVFTLLRP